MSKMDDKTLERIMTAHPYVREELLTIYRAICIALSGSAMCRFSWVLRTDEQQEKLFKKGGVTNARAGQSYHNYGLAVDVVLLIDKDGNGTFESISYKFDVDYDGDGASDWKEIDEIFDKYGWRGLHKKDGKRYDLPHFQKTFGYHWSELMKMPKDENGYVKF